MNITDCVFELQKLKAENAALRKRLTRCTQDNFDAAMLVAVAENILFKRKQGVPLEAVDFEWLERAVGEKA